MKVRNIAIACAAVSVVAACAPVKDVKKPFKPLTEIYVVPILGHLDYGFTASQREVKALWPRIYRQGIAFLETHPEAKLTSSSLLPLEWFYEKAAPDEWRRFKTLVKSGRWELTAGLLNANTSVLSEAEAPRLFFTSRRWAEKLGVPIRSWLHEDVPGLTWNMAEAATDARINFIAVGANEMGGLSPLPDRLPPLFYWLAPDSARVMVSVRGGSGYMEGGLDLALHVMNGLDKRLENYTRALREKGYPLDKSLVLFSSGDNSGPTFFPALMKTVKQWNSQENHLPRLRVSTLSEFYGSLTEAEKALVPVLRGDWPASAQWEVLVRRTPHAEAAAREAKRKLLTAQLLSVIMGNKQERNYLRACWRNILLYDEHSGAGAWPGKLTHKQVIEQNKTEYAFAITALDGVESSINRQLFSRKLLLSLAVPYKPVFACNVSSEKRGGFIEWSKPKDEPEQSGIAAYTGEIPEWSCTLSPASKIKLPPPLKGDFSGPVRLETPVRLEPPLFLSSAIMKVKQAPELPVVKKMFRLSSGTYAVTLRWGPVSRLPAAASMRGWTAVLSLDSPVENFKWARGGLMFTQSENLGYPLTWQMPGEGVVAQLGGGERILLSNLDGMPVFPNVPSRRDALWYLLYVQGPPVAVRDGTGDRVPNEPDAYKKPLQSLWLSRRAPLNAAAGVRDLRKLSRPITGFAYKEGVACERETADPREILFRSFSVATSEVVIEEIKWADFGDGIVVRLRNLSNKCITATLVSNIGSIDKASGVDGLERDIRLVPHAKGWARIRLDPMEVVRVRLNIKGNGPLH